MFMGIARERMGTYQLAFATFGVFPALAFILVVVAQRQMDGGSLSIAVLA